MAEITNYATLKSTVADYLNRTDLTAQIPGFIQLAEQDLRRNLIAAPIHLGQSLTAGSDFFSVSGEIMSLSMDTDAYQYPIRFTTFEALSELRRPGSGVPLYAAVVGNVIYLDVEPDSDYDVIAVYSPAFVPLLDDLDATPTLLAAPDAYLYGALKEAAPFLEHDERNILWSQKYQKAVDDENAARERAMYSGKPMQPRLPIILG